LNIDSLELVRAAIADVNNQNEEGEKIDPDGATKLFGVDAAVDSLMLVNLFVSLEQKIEDATGKIVILVDEDALADTSHPFRTVASLAQHVDKIINR
jgi:acyl carrier protein